MSLQDVDWLCLLLAGSFFMYARASRQKLDYYELLFAGQAAGWRTPLYLLFFNVFGVASLGCVALAFRVWL